MNSYDQLKILEEFPIEEKFRAIDLSSSASVLGDIHDCTVQNKGEACAYHCLEITPEAIFCSELIVNQNIKRH